MMIKITDPEGLHEIKIQATEEKIDGRPIWRIVFPKNEIVFITRLNGQWKSIGKLMISYDLLNEIGIKLHPLAIMNTLNLRCIGD
jgi:hypothetical protein